MDKDEVLRLIQTRLDESGSKVLNRNAFDALFIAIGGNPIAALSKIFLGRSGALGAERTKVTQDAILTMLCKIDEAITEAEKVTASAGVSLSGLVETHGRGTASTTGVNIVRGSGPVQFEPGTRILTTHDGPGSLTGVKIGGSA